MPLSLFVLSACGEGQLSFDSAPPEESDADTDTDTDTAADADTDTGGPPLDGHATAVLGVDNPHLAIVTISLDRAATVWVEYGERLPGDRATPTWEVPADTETELLVLGLHAGVTTSLVVHAETGGSTWESTALEVTAPPLASGFQRCLATTLVDRHDPDEVFCTNGWHSAGHPFMCVDHQGEVVYQVAGLSSEILYSMRPLSTGGWAAVSTTSSMLALFDDRSALVAQYTPSWFSGKTRWEHQFIDNHEVMEITDGEWAGALGIITSSYEYVPGYDWLVSPGFIVFDPVTEDVLWDWSAFGDLSDGVANDPLLDYTRTAYGGFYGDYAHANSLVHRIDPDGREVFWLSMRSQDWLVKIDVESDAIVWRFGLGGDVELVDDLDDPDSAPRPARDWMFGEHDIRFHTFDGDRTSFTVFDNGYYREQNDGSWAPSYSRIVEYRLDEATLRAEQVFAYGPVDGSDPEYLYAWGMGGAEILPDDERAVWSSGYGTGVGYGGPFLREVSYPEGELLWTLDCVDYGDGFYRVLWAPSLYELDWRVVE